MPTYQVVLTDEEDAALASYIEAATRRRDASDTGGDPPPPMTEEAALHLLMLQGLERTRHHLAQLVEPLEALLADLPAPQRGVLIQRIPSVAVRRRLADLFRGR